MAEQNIVGPKKKRAKYEVIVLVVVIVAAVIVGYGVYSARAKAEKSKLMISELEQVRSAIITYKTLNKTNPPDLTSLTKMTYTFAPGERPKTYLANIPTNKKGQLIDPFGNPYKYELDNGWVYSTTANYKGW